jgi:hypothetical protein
VLQELENHAEVHTDVTQIALLEGEIAALAEREERLVKLYTLGTIREEIAQKQLEEISRESTALNHQLSSLQRPVGYDTRAIDRDLLKQVCSGVTQWLKNADDSDKRMALDALQVSVEATAKSATLTGVLPVNEPEFIRNEQSSRCSCNGD